MAALEIPGYELGEVLGRGGFASVYRAVQLTVGRDVAVKVDNRVLATERDRRRFFREVTAAGRLSAHPHVVGIYDAGALGDARPYLVMELCPGGSLDGVLRTSGPLSPAAVRDIGVGIADALGAAHASGVLHRDIKPANILVNAYGVVGLSDFGLASVLAPDGGQSATREALTPAYAAPEAFTMAEPTVEADVYSLAATLYTLLSGTPPRYPTDGTRPSLAQLLTLHERPVVDLPVGPDLMEVLHHGLAVDPARRWPSANALRDALVAADPWGRSSTTAPAWSATPRPPLAAPASTTPSSPTTPPPSTTPPPPAPPGRGRRVGPGIAVAAATVVVVLGAVLVTRSLLGQGPGPTSTAGTSTGRPTTTAAVAVGPAGASPTPGGTTPAAGPTDLSLPTALAGGDLLMDGTAVTAALASVTRTVGAPLRLTMLTVAGAGQYTLLVVDVRKPGDPLAVDRYMVNLGGEVTGPQEGSSTTLVDSGQNQVTKASADARTFTAARLPLGRWDHVTAAVLRRAAIRDGAVSAWVAYVFSGKLHLVFQVQSRYGGASVITDETGRITNVS